VRLAVGSSVIDPVGCRAVEPAGGPGGVQRPVWRHDEPVLLYAMGDGNHSFATAKIIWENLKRAAPDPAAIMNHPARHALVELVNLHDEGLEFEAIHRVVFGVDPDHLLAGLAAFCQAQGSAVTVQDYPSWPRRVRRGRPRKSPSRHVIAFTSSDRHGVLSIDRPRLTLPVASLQAFLDDYLTQQPDARLDYIHGEDALEQLGAQPGNLGFYLPTLAKNDFFRTVIRDGALPRKTFSMGEADEKRFYLECRRILKNEGGEVIARNHGQGPGPGASAQYRHCRACRRRQDHADRADAVLRRRVPQNRRSP
jgi:hypothetical protein